MLNLINKIHVRVNLGLGYMQKYHITICFYHGFTILSQNFVMSVLLFCLSSAAKLYFTIIKTNPFKVTKYHK